MMRNSQRSVVLVKPRTFMNRSGDCLAAVSRYSGIRPEEMLVVVDDVDLPLGQIRVRPQGGAGGHNGLRSVIERLGSQAFPRVRLGVGARPPGTELVEFVLGRFPSGDRPAVEAMVSRGADAAMAAIEQGVSAAMNIYNVAS